MSEAGFHKAMKRPAVRDHLQEVQNRFVSEVEGRRAIYTARALEVAADLMENSKSDSVRARMAEFLANGGKTGSSVNVHVDARPMGYEYVRPGQQIVEIQPVSEAPLSDRVGANNSIADKMLQKTLNPFLSDLGESVGCIKPIYGWNCSL